MTFALDERAQASDIELLLKLMNLVHMFPSIILRDFVALFDNQEAAERELTWKHASASFDFLRLLPPSGKQPWSTAQTGNFAIILVTSS